MLKYSAKHLGSSKSSGFAWSAVNTVVKRFVAKWLGIVRRHARGAVL